jgi:hypothetical protein
MHWEHSGPGQVQLDEMALRISPVGSVFLSVKKGKETNLGFHAHGTLGLMLVSPYFSKVKVPNTPSFQFSSLEDFGYRNPPD